METLRSQDTIPRELTIALLAAQFIELTQELLRSPADRAKLMHIVAHLKDNKAMLEKFDGAAVANKLVLPSAFLTELLHTPSPGRLHRARLALKSAEIAKMFATFMVRRQTTKFTQERAARVRTAGTQHTDSATAPKPGQSTDRKKLN